MDPAREPQDTEEESVTDAESESESDMCSWSGTESESESDTEQIRNKWGKRKMKKQNRKQPGTSSHCTPSKKRQAKESRQYLRLNESELLVKCGNKEGVLYVEKFNDSTDGGQKCILSEGQWFKPNEFERFGGKEKSKKWKTSICCDGIPLQKFIEETQTDKGSANSEKIVEQNIRRRELMNVLKGFPESYKRLFDKTDSIPVHGIEKNTLQMETIPVPDSSPDSSSDESETVAERVKMNMRESVMLAEAVSKKTTEPVGSTASDRDPPAHSVDASEPEVSPVVEEAVQSTDDPTGAGQLSLSAEWQNPVASEETRETRHLQLYELLTKQFNTINHTLQSIDLSLKKLVENNHMTHCHNTSL